MAQIVKPQPLDAESDKRAMPLRPELIGSPHLVPPRLAEEHEIGIDGPHRVGERGAQHGGRGIGERHGARRAVLGIRQRHHALLQVHLAATQRADLAGTHAGVERQPHDLPEHRIRVLVAGAQQLRLFIERQAPVPPAMGWRLTNVGDRVVDEPDAPLLDRHGVEVRKQREFEAHGAIADNPSSSR